MKIRKLVVSIMLLLTLWSLLLTVLYRFTPITNLRPLSDQVGLMTSGDRYTPIDIIDYHLNLIRNATSIHNYLSNLIKSYYGGASFIPLILGLENNVVRINETANGFTLNIISGSNSKNAIPTKLEYYIEENNQLYFDELTFSAREINFVCNTLCLPSNAEINERLLTTNQTLQKDNFVGVFLENRNVQIYFKNQDNLFIKGDRINLDQYTQDYNLQS